MIKLSNLCIKIIIENLELIYKISKKRLFIIPEKISENLFKYCLLNEKSLNFNELKFFSYKITNLNNVILTKNQYFFIESYDFLNNLNLNNLNINLKNNKMILKNLNKNFRINVNNLKLTIENLLINEFNEKFFLNLYVNGKIEFIGNNFETDCHFFKILLKNSSDNLHKLFIKNIYFLNDSFNEITKIIKMKNNLIEFYVFSINCWNYNSSIICSTDELCKSLISSSNSLQTLKFDLESNAVWCLKHINLIFQYCHSLNHIEISLMDKCLYDQIEFLNNLHKFCWKSLNILHLIIPIKNELLSDLLILLKSCKYINELNLNIKLITIINITDIFESLKFCSNSLKKLTIVIQHTTFYEQLSSYLEYDFNDFLLNFMNLHEFSITGIKFLWKIINFENLKTLSINSISLTNCNLNMEKNLLIFYEFLKSLKTVENFFIEENSLSENGIEYILNGLNNSLINLNGITINIGKFNENDAFKLSKFLNKCINLKKFHLNSTLNINNSFNPILNSLLKFKDNLESLSFECRINEIQIRQLIIFVENCHSLKNIYIKGDFSLLKYIVDLRKSLFNSKYTLKKICFDGFFRGSNIDYHFIDSFNCFIQLEKLSIGYIHHFCINDILEKRKSLFTIEFL